MPPEVLGHSPSAEMTDQVAVMQVPAVFLLWLHRLHTVVVGRGVVDCRWFAADKVVVQEVERTSSRRLSELVTTSIFYEPVCSSSF